MRRFFVALLVLFVLFLGTAAVAPLFIDWSRYKDDIAARVAAATGRPVSIDGDLRLRLLPTPSAEVDGLRIGPGPGGGPDLLRVARAQAAVALLPLLSQRVRVETVELVDPVLVLPSPPGPPATGSLAAAPQAPRTGTGDGWSADDVRLENVLVRGGTVVWLDAQGHEVDRIGDLAGEVSAGSLAGPFRMLATATYREVPVRVELSTGRATEAGALPARASVLVAGGAGTVRFAGLAAAAGGVRLQGDLRIEGPQLDGLLAALGIADAERVGTMAQPYSARATVTGGTDALRLSDMELQLGEGRGSGSATIVPRGPDGRPKVDAVLSLNRIDAAALAGLADAATGGAVTGRDGGFALPHATGSVELTAEAVPVGGQLVRQMRLSASLGGDGTLAVNRLSAQLPGAATVSATGVVTADGGTPRVRGRIDGSADNLRALLQWLGIEPTGVPTDRLNRLSVSAQVEGTPDDFQVRDADLTVDTTRLRGGMAVTRGDRTGIGLRLDADQFNLDAYLPPDTGLSDIRTVLAAFDANVEVAAAELVYRGQVFRDLVLDGMLNRGEASLTELRIGRWAGLSGSVQGRIANLDRLEGLNLAFALRSEGATALGRAFGLPDPPAALARLGAFDAGGRISGSAEEMRIDLSVEAMGGSVEAGGTLRGLPGQPELGVRLRARTPEAGDVVRLFAPEWRPEGGLGPLDAFAEITAGPTGRWAFNAIQGQFGPVTAAGDATVNLNGPRPRFEATLRASDIDMDRLTTAPRRPAAPVPISGRPPFGSDPLPFDGLRAFDGKLALTAAGIRWNGIVLTDTALAATLDEGTLVLEQLDGRMQDGRVGLAGRVAAGGPDAQPDVTAKLTLAGVKLPDTAPGSAPRDATADGALTLVGGTLDADWDMTARGNSPAALVGTLSGTGRVRVREGSLLGADLTAAAAEAERAEDPRALLAGMDRAVAAGSTRFSRFDANVRIETGIVRTEDLRIAAAGFRVEAKGAIDLPRWSIDLGASIDPAGDAPPFGLALAGPVGQPRRVLDVATLQTDLAERLRQRQPPPGPAAPAVQAPTMPPPQAAPQPRIQTIQPAQPAPPPAPPGAAPPAAPAPAAPTPAAPIPANPSPAAPTGDPIQNLLRSLVR
ncbi:MAG TPA: AsmA-like C-terminal region-containing protein [Azospirillaceae bacterium]|nr:AsmA-like C-terminal region-containing protein [Azospirillaceae bacterium]